MNAIAAIVIAAAASFSLPASAASDQGGHAGHGAMSEKSNADAPMTEGMVKKIDKSVGKVTVSHGQLPNGMPAMTMVFKVKELAWLDQMKDGGRILFGADQINGIMTIIRFKGVQ